MAKGIIHSGSCGQITIVEVKETENQNVNIVISSNCPNIKKVAEDLKELEAYKELFSPFPLSRTFKTASKNIPHPSCPVPSGILKTIEVEVNLSVPQDATIKIEK